MPESGPVQNVVYTDTYVSVAQQGVKEDGTTFSDKFLFFDQFSYKYDRNWNFVAISDTSGYAGGSDVMLAVDRKLASASASATVATFVCTFGRRSSSCADGPAITLTASWTGTGDIIRSGDNYRVNSKSFTYTAHSRGSYRDASASASIGGVGTGTSLFADIYNFTSHEVSVCHGC